MASTGSPAKDVSQGYCEPTSVRRGSKSLYGVGTIGDILSTELGGYLDFKSESTLVAARIADTRGEAGAAFAAELVCVMRRKLDLFIVRYFRCVTGMSDADKEQLRKSGYVPFDAARDELDRALIRNARLSIWCEFQPSNTSRHCFATVPAGEQYYVTLPVARSAQAARATARCLFMPGSRGFMLPAFQDGGRGVAVVTDRMPGFVGEKDMAKEMIDAFVF